MRTGSSHASWVTFHILPVPDKSEEGVTRLTPDSALVWMSHNRELGREPITDTQDTGAQGRPGLGGDGKGG